MDEAFLDVSGAQRLLGRPAGMAELIRRRVREEQALPCSVGVAPSKFVAKLASTRAKPDGLVVVPTDRVLDYLHPLPVEALWGVGERSAEALRRLGLTPVHDLAHPPVGSIPPARGRGAGSAWSVYASKGCSRPVGPPANWPWAPGSGAGQRRNGRPTRRWPGSAPPRYARPAFLDRPVSYPAPSGPGRRGRGREPVRRQPGKNPTPDLRPAFRPAYPLVDLRVSSHLAVTVRRPARVDILTGEECRAALGTRAAAVRADRAVACRGPQVRLGRARVRPALPRPAPTAGRRPTRRRWSGACCLWGGELERAHRRGGVRGHARRRRVRPHLTTPGARR